MEDLSPVGQVAGVIMLGLVVIVFILALFTEFFNNLWRKK